MQLDKLQLHLRPRPNRQALDLGFTLLGLGGKQVYAVWLALWLPWCALLGLLTMLAPRYEVWWALVMWWFLPLFERAPLYVLARLVFGEQVSQRQALRAWPSQLRGGMLGMLTWGRLNAARGLNHAVWQLEGARGKTARMRKDALGRSGTFGSAFWFGVVCSIFEAVLFLGVIGFVSLFISNTERINPFALFDGSLVDLLSPWLRALMFAGQALAMAVLGPVYVACCFALYLNRRATLEAWDLEIALRQITPPQRTSTPVAQKPLVKTVTSALLAVLLAALAAGLLPFSAAPLQAQSVAQSVGQAAPPSTANTTNDKADASDSDSAHWDKCKPPSRYEHSNPSYWDELHQLADQSSAHQAPPEQLALRAQLRRVMQMPDVRLYHCVYERGMPEPAEPKADKPSSDPIVRADDVSGFDVAQMVKITLIASVLCLLLWLGYRYRQNFAGLLGGLQRAPAATQIAGLDIRPESLPADVASQVQTLWSQGQHRAALALLYRATLSRLVEFDHLHLPVGATEGDCLRLAERALGKQPLREQRVQIIASSTVLWRNAAYGQRWPETAELVTLCHAWRAEFDAPATPATASSEPSPKAKAL